jgi:hypothetical protein
MINEGVNGRNFVGKMRFAVLERAKYDALPPPHHHYHNINFSFSRIYSRWFYGWSTGWVYWMMSLSRSMLPLLDFFHPELARLTGALAQLTFELIVVK